LKIHISLVRKHNHRSFIPMSSWGGTLRVWRFQAIWRQKFLKVCLWAWKGGVCRFGFVKNFNTNFLDWLNIHFHYQHGVPHPQQMRKLLNYCRDSCIGITKVDVRIAWFVHFHLCLLGVFISCHCVYKVINSFLGCKGVSWVLYHQLII